MHVCISEGSVLSSEHAVTSQALALFFMVQRAQSHPLNGRMVSVTCGQHGGCWVAWRWCVGGY